MAHFRGDEPEIEPVGISAVPGRREPSEVRGNRNLDGHPVESRDSELWYRGPSRTGRGHPPKFISRGIRRSGYSSSAWTWKKSGLRRWRGRRRQWQLRHLAVALIGLIEASGCGCSRIQSPETLYVAADEARRHGELPDALARAEKGIQACREMRDSTWPLRFQLLKVEILLTLGRVSEVRPLLRKRPGCSASRWGELAPRQIMDQGELGGGNPGMERRRDALLGPGARSRIARRRRGALHWHRSRGCGAALLLYDFDRDFNGKLTALSGTALDLAKAQRDDYLIATAFIDLGYIRLRQISATTKPYSAVRSGGPGRCAEYSVQGQP